MASRVAGKIKLQSVDELLGVPEIAGTQEIEIGRIHAFPNHPFKVLDDEKMDTLVDSIRKNGILNPVIVRPDQSGNYEMISGHRRLHAARIVGLKKIPAIVKEMSDDEAIIKMVDMEYHIGVLFRQRLKISLLQVDAFLQIFMQNLQFESLVPVWQSVKQQEQRQRCVW